jgi:beta-glucanase (GH16 family)
MRTTIYTIVSTLACLLCAGCGQEEVSSGRAATPAPAVAAAQPAPAPEPTAVPPAAPTPVVAAQPVPGQLLDLAATDVLSRVRATGQASADLRLLDAAAGTALEFTCTAGAAWPGIAITPPSGAWNLAAFAGIEAVVENAGSGLAVVSMRVDEQGGDGKAWNGATVKLAPGATTTLRVRFGYSWGAPGYAIDPARISQVQVYTGKPNPGCVLRLRSLQAAGKAGEKPGVELPKSIPTKHVPGNPAMLSFAAGIDRQRLHLTAVQVEAAPSAAAITVSAAGSAAELLYRPAQPWDLRDFREAVFVVRNPGSAPVRVLCRLDGGQSDDRVGSEAELAPGERREIVVPFSPGVVWQGRSPARADAPAAGAAFTGAPQEQSSVGLISDAVSAAAVGILSPTPGVSVVWEGVTASAGGPADLPAWIGTRPPVDGDWVRIMADEFDEASLDTARWTPRLPWIGPIPYELQRYNDKNVTVANGHLVIHCEKKTGHLYDNPAWPARDYTTGAVTSYPKWRMHYGYVEARMKLPKALGLWPGFWTMPDRGPLAPEASTIGSIADWQADWEAARTTPDKNRRRSTDVDGMEFDIMEHVTRFGPFRYNIAAHWDGYGKEHKSVGSSRIYSQPDADGYIVAGLLWEPGRLTWFCNGKPVGTWADPRVASVPASLKFTVQMGGWAGNEVDDTALPADFLIDWVRVWQLRERLPSGQ